MKMDKKRFWTLRYTLINMLYFSAFCTIHAYSAVYLLDCGFSNTEIGILLAVANIASAVFQPYIAGIIDKPGWLSNRRFIIISCTVMAIGSAVLMIWHDNMIAIFIIFAAIYMIQFTYMPAMTAMFFEYQKSGCKINYGLARGLGSCGYAITSFFIGSAVERDGVDILLIVTIFVMIASVIVVFLFKKPASESVESSEEDDQQSAHNNIFEFARLYPSFMIFIVAVICFFFGHNMVNDFLIQIIQSLGGGETEMGYATFLSALLELPMMAMTGMLLKKISSDKLLIASGVAFLIKISILIVATDMIGLYFSQSLQFFAYALFIPASAYYVSQVMEPLDQVKGQAFVTSAFTIGGVFSNLASGVILDNLGIHAMLLSGIVVTALGVIVVIIAMRMPKQKIQR